MAIVIAILVAGAACSGCTDGQDRVVDDGDYHEAKAADDEGRVGVVQAALSATDPVSAAVEQSCTTAAVKGLSTQLVEEIQCLRPGTLASIEGDPGLDLGGAVFPWLQTAARPALLEAQKQRGVTMVINSALRTLPQQYLLYRWYKTNRCGIGLAALPGKSNHEAGLAVDIQDNAGWRTAMSAHEFTWLGASDPVHFDYKGAGSVDIGGVSILAFQRLWNRNHPEDPIGEDSTYGSSTEERLAKSPVGGFAIGANCTDAGAPQPPRSTDAGGASSSDAGLGSASGDRSDGAGDGCSIGRRGAASGAASTSPLFGLTAFLGLLRLARRHSKKSV